MKFKHLFLALIFSQTASALLSEGGNGSRIREKSLELNIGYRRDNLKWEFRDPALNLCEVFRSEWNRLYMVNVGATGKVSTCNNLYARLGGSFAPVLSSHVSGNTWDVSGAAGFQINLCDDDFRFTPLLGFGYNKINLFAHKSNYHSYWTGPTLGFEALYHLNDAVDLFTRFDYQWIVYRATSDIQESHFRHWASGRGLLWNFGGNYLFCSNWAAGLKFTFNDLRTFRYGRIRANLREECLIKDTELDPVRWRSNRIELTLARYF